MYPKIALGALAVVVADPVSLSASIRASDDTNPAMKERIRDAERKDEGYFEDQEMKRGCLLNETRKHV